MPGIESRSHTYKTCAQPLSSLSSPISSLKLSTGQWGHPTSLACQQGCKPSRWTPSVGWTLEAAPWTVPILPGCCQLAVCCSCMMGSLLSTRSTDLHSVFVHFHVWPGHSLFQSPTCFVHTQLSHFYGFTFSFLEESPWDLYDSV